MQGSRARGAEGLSPSRSRDVRCRPARVDLTCVVLSWSAAGALEAFGATHPLRRHSPWLPGGGIVAFLGDEVFESVSGVEWVSVEPRSWHRPGLYDGHMSQQGTIEVTVGEDGAVVLSADQLDRLGAHPGDRVRVEPVAPRRIRSMLGSGVGAPGPSRGFSTEDLRAVRREMGDRIGDDLTA